MTEETLECSEHSNCEDDVEKTQELSAGGGLTKITTTQDESRSSTPVHLCQDETTTNSCGPSTPFMDALPTYTDSIQVELRTSKKLLDSCIHTITVDTVNEPQSIDLGLTASNESPGSTSEISATKSDTDLSTSDTSENHSIDVSQSELDSSENVSVDLSTTHWELTQSEQDYESIATCRICHCDGELEPLISPCLCTGTVKHIHHSCLMDWLKRCVKTKCELCLQPISVNRKTKPLKQWRRPGQKPTPIIWLLTFIVALTLNIASIAKDGSQKCVSNPCIIFYVVGAIGALLGFAFFYHFLIVSIRYVKQWMALNEDWTLDGLNKTNGNLGNANLALSDKSLGAKEQRDLQMVEVV